MGLGEGIRGARVVALGMVICVVLEARLVAVGGVQRGLLVVASWGMVLRWCGR